MSRRALVILFAVGLLAGAVVVLGALGGRRLAQADRDREAQKQAEALQNVFEQAGKDQERANAERDRWAKEARQASIDRARKHLANGDPDTARVFVEGLAERGGTADIPPELLKLLPR